MLKRLLIGFFVSLTFLAASVQAQMAVTSFAPEVDAVLSKAIEAHGGEALLNYTSSRDSVMMSIYAPNGQVAMELEGTVLIDTAAQQLKSDFRQGDAPLIVQVINDEGAFSYAPQTGTLKLPPTQAKELRASLVAGVFALNQLDAYDDIHYVGEATLEGVTGTQLDFDLDGAIFSRLYDDAGLLVAVQSTSSQVGLTTTLLSDYREVEGIMLPFRADTFVSGQAFMSMESLSVDINPEFAADTFRLE